MIGYAAPSYLHYYQALMAGMREAIAEARFAAFADDFAAGQAAGDGVAEEDA